MIYRDYAYAQYPYLNTINQSYELLSNRTLITKDNQQQYQKTSKMFLVPELGTLPNDTVIINFNRIEVRNGDVKILFFDKDKQPLEDKNVIINSANVNIVRREGLLLRSTKNQARIAYRRNFSLTKEQIYWVSYLDNDNISQQIERDAAYFQIVATYDIENGCAAAAFTLLSLDPTPARDNAFLQIIDHCPIKEQSVRILLLDAGDQIKYDTNNQLIYLEGYVASGSINVNGSSAIRRTGSLQMVVTEETKNILSKNNLININTRFALEVGFNNPTYFYSENPIIWLPQGVFVVTGCSIKEDTNNLTLSVNFKDKSAYLNGEMGGVFPAALDLNTKDIINSEGKVETQDILIKEIVEGMLAVYGGLTPNEMHISIPAVAIQALGWKGKQDAYLIEGKDVDASNPTAIITLDYNEAIAYKNQWTDATLKVISYGDNMGWRYTHFTYPQKELKANPGDNILTILNKITSFFKNYEYYFDTFGLFQFKEKKDSVMDNSEIEYAYEFLDNHSGVISYNNSPQYLNVKNDYVVWGEQATTNGNKRAIQYHLAFDRNPPMIPEDKWKTARVPVNQNWIVNSLIAIPSNAVTVKIKGTIAIDSSEKKLKVWYWTDRYSEPAFESCSSVASDTLVSIEETIVLKANQVYLWFGEGSIATTANIQGIFYDADGKAINTFTQASYLASLMQPVHELEAILFYGEQNNYYYQELLAQIPSMVTLTKQQEYRQKEWEALEIDHSNANYWLDLIDISTLSSDMLLDIHDIGRRTVVFSNIGVNCVEEPADIVPYLLNITGEDFDDVEQHALVLNVDKKLEEGFYSGGMMSGAAEYIRSVLQNYITFNESVSLTTNPIYYLEPNTVVRVEREDVSISGDFTINTFNIPLDTKSQMTLQLKRNLEMLTSDK